MTGQIATIRNETGSSGTRGTSPVLVVCGLAAEARIAVGNGIVAVAAPPNALERRLDALAGSFAAVVSFGLCGGLAPALEPGAPVLSDAVEHDGDFYRCDPVLVDLLRERLGIAPPSVKVLSCARNAPVVAAAAKARLRAQNGADAVDTESHLAARFAGRHGLPFAVLRAVCDAGDRDLPPLSLRAIGPDGRLDWGAIAQEIAVRPRQLAALPATALATARAFRTLRRVRGRLGSRFGLS